MAAGVGARWSTSGRAQRCGGTRAQGEAATRMVRKEVGRRRGLELTRSSNRSFCTNLKYGSSVEKIVQLKKYFRKKDRFFFFFEASHLGTRIGFLECRWMQVAGPSPGTVRF